MKTCLIRRISNQELTSLMSTLEVPPDLEFIDYFKWRNLAHEGDWLFIARKYRS